MCHFLDELVENVSDVEFELKDELLLLEAEIQDFNDETEILTVNRDMACLEKDTCNEALELYNVSNKSLKSIASMNRKKMDKLRTVKSKLINAKNERLGDDDSLANLLMNILEKVNIKKQAFHGGAMNGVCCRRLLDNIDTIFEEIRELCLERLLFNKRRNVVSNERLLTNTINSFQFLFETIDIVCFWVAYHMPCGK